MKQAESPKQDTYNGNTDTSMMSMKGRKLSAAAFTTASEARYSSDMVWVGRVHR